MDTLDSMDLDFVSVGEKAVVGEGTTILGHSFKDGVMVFSEASFPLASFSVMTLAGCIVDILNNLSGSLPLRFDQFIQGMLRFGLRLLSSFELLQRGLHQVLFNLHCWY